MVVLSLLGYLGGLGLYAAPHLTTLQATLLRLPASPVATLTSAFPLPSPVTFALSPIVLGTAAPGGALLAGVVVLPLVVVTTVARFGRGSAWLYALGSILPIATLAAWPMAPTPLWVALLGLVVAPLVGVGGFLFDVGRYLLATRT